LAAGLSLFLGLTFQPALAANGNFVVNGDISSSANWRLLRNAAYDGSTSTSSGSGSLKISYVGSPVSAGSNAQVQSDLISITPGTTYSLSVSLKSSVAPVGVYCLFSVYNRSGAFSRNVAGSNQAPSQAGVWQTVTSTFTAGATDGYVRVIYGRDKGTRNDGDLWLDGVSLTEFVPVVAPVVNTVTTATTTTVSSALPLQITRVGANLLKNPAATSGAYWGMSRNAAYDSTVTRTSGSGSLKISWIDPTLSQTGAQVQSELIPVTPGQSYTLAAYLKSSVWPTLAYSLIAVYDAQGKFKANVRGSYQATSSANLWQETVSFYTAQPGDGFIKLVYGRQNGPRNDGDIWVDDLYVGEGRGFEQPPSAKEAFDGAMVRIDSLGNYEVLRNGSWQPFFPFAIYQDISKTSYQDYSNQGFNCVVFNQFGTDIIQRAQDAKSSFNPDGMMSMIELSQYILPTMNQYNNLADLKTRLQALVKSPQISGVLDYYFDHEAYTQYDVPKAVTDLVKQYDVSASGQRLHPIWANTGNSGMARMINGLVDTVGDYANNGYNRYLSLGNVEGQKKPLALGITSAATPEELRNQLYQTLIAGGKGFAFYKDPFHIAPYGPVSNLPMWNEVPKLRAEVDKLLPLLRQPQWTHWKAVASDPRLIVGTRDYNLEGYLLLANPTDQTITGTISLSGLSYLPTMVEDALSGSVVEGVTGSSLSILIPPYGTSAYRLR
jgi:hypothetical protein